MVVTDSEELFLACRSLRNLCFQADRRFVHDRLGWNYRMTNLQAAVGVAQLERLEGHVIRKRQIGKLYSELLDGLSGVTIPLSSTEYASNIYWVFGVVLGDDSPSREAVVAELSRRGIGTRPFFWPMHEQPVFYGRFDGRGHPHAEMLARRGFYLPSGLGITDDEVVRVAMAVREVARA